MIDYMIMEAVFIKATQEDEKARKDAAEEAARKKWQTNVDDLKNQL